ncbi:beta-class carbonic anhydrase [Actinokineospora soli]|uniref:carbonic anhydrase n=1 Tax=Actinokineospora soli TaxID=1048753 RepID=A0ABW2TQW2_9PSEU
MGILDVLDLPDDLTTELDGKPDRHLAVVACMDARMDVYRILDLEVGEANVIRNAGGVITDDVIRSLTVSQWELETSIIVLVHHTKCGMLRFPEAEFRERLAEHAGARPEWSADGFDDVERDVRESIRRIELNPFLKHKHCVLGYVYDVDTGERRFVARSKVLEAA